MVGSLFLFNKVSAMYVEYKQTKHSRSRVDSDQNMFILDCERLARAEFKNEDFAWREIMTTAPPQALDIHIKERLEKSWHTLGEFGPYSKLHQQWDHMHRPKRTPEQFQASSSTGF